jgi:hypothetical protein
MVHRAVLGPWINRPWLNALASLIVGTLLMLSLILVVTTLVPGINVGALVVGSAATLATALLIIGLLAMRNAGRAPALHEPAMESVDKMSWRMPPLALLSRPAWSRTRQVGMWSLRVYLLIAVILLLVKAVQLGTGR